MMPSLYGVTLPGPTPIIYASDSSMHDYISKPTQPTHAAPRRLSRGSNGQAHGQRPNMSMRIVKPSSANNSPRSSILAGRRRTLMNSGDLARKRQQALDQAAAPMISTDYFDTTRAARPVSWHPSSHLAQPQLQVTQPASQYPFPAFNDAELFQAFPHFSPTPATYSCNTSPSATFSPLSLPFPSFEGPGYPAAEGWNLATQTAPSYVSSASDNSSFYEPFPALPAAAVKPASSLEPSPSSAAASEWHSFAMHGFSSTSPPTPETLPPAQQAQPGVPSEESIPYQALEESEEEGEILVGMGLYDAPAKYDSDPQLDNYRSTMSQLLGSALRSSPSMGKGLKLEESWEPPPDSDDEEEGDDDDDDDADAEAEAQQKQEQKSAPVASTTATTITNWV